MCEQEYANREKNHKKYHMGLVTRQGAEKSLHNVTSEHFKQHYPVPPKPLDTSLTCKVKMYHNSIYIAGKYLNAKVMEIILDKSILLDVHAAPKVTTYCYFR